MERDTYKVSSEKGQVSAIYHHCRKVRLTPRPNKMGTVLIGQSAPGLPLLWSLALGLEALNISKILIIPKSTPNLPNIPESYTHATAPAHLHVYL